MIQHNYADMLLVRYIHVHKWNKHKWVPHG